MIYGQILRPMLLLLEAIYSSDEQEHRTRKANSFKYPRSSGPNSPPPLIVRATMDVGDGGTIVIVLDGLTSSRDRVACSSRVF